MPLEKRRSCGCSGTQPPHSSAQDETAGNERTLKEYPAERPFRAAPAATAQARNVFSRKDCNRKKKALPPDCAVLPAADMRGDSRNRPFQPQVPGLLRLRHETFRQPCRCPEQHGPDFRADESRRNERQRSRRFQDAACRANGTPIRTPYRARPAEKDVSRADLNKQRAVKPLGDYPG